MEQEKIEVTEEVKEVKEIKEVKETKMRDEETLEKLNPKKMNQKELVFMLGKCRAERDHALDSLEATKRSAEQAFKKARETEEAYNNLLAQVNQTYGFIDRATENFKESISLVIKGRM